MRNRRYEFERGGGVIWTLVFDQSVHRWYVEKRLASDAIRMTLGEFEKSRFGQHLGSQLNRALYEAADDL